MTIEKRKLTREEKDLIRKEIEYFVPSYIASLCNAYKTTVDCSHKDLDMMNSKTTEVLIFKGCVSKVFCIFNGKGDICLYERNKKKICYLYSGA
jgi:hypothetical protein